MSVAGLKKQFHKATQCRVPLLNSSSVTFDLIILTASREKVGGAEGTKLDEDFKEMEKKVDVTSRAVLDIMTKTTEYLQPNPASRAKLSMISTMSKMRGQEKGPGYPGGERLALMDASEAMKELGEVKDALDIEVKQNFIDPLQNLHDKDLKEIQHHLKKMEGRRLDFDYKKKRQGKVQDEEIKQALEKFDESKEIAEQSISTCWRATSPPRWRTGELGFKEGDVITLTNQIDDNWYEGMINGQSGFFPINYVDILVPLPH
ncbi:hypothetical protein F7725_004997 [Dissostichus mawsoni]|uniref:SH3 domain containing GRB2 like 1, endophilin A2 n=1 Tax=Dissostichus mawsoni TaxID=36200 RepID=A0A7J5XL17_DISMA|nr:hypothetical protein F7725_004997 [Dissostichus mawsoni]